MRLFPADRTLPCRCRVAPGDVEPGQVIARRCQHGRWTGVVRESLVLSGLARIAWLPDGVPAHPSPSGDALAASEAHGSAGVNVTAAAVGAMRGRRDDLEGVAS